MAYDPRMGIAWAPGNRYVPAASDAEMIGEAMWPGIVNGTPISKAHIADAQRRFLNSGAGMMPLLPNYDENVVRKAIMNHGIDGDYTDRIRNTLERQNNQWLNDVSKAFYSELPDVCELKKALTTSSSLMHVIADQDVTFLYKRPYPLQALIPTEANKGKTANIDLMGPYDFGSAFPGVEDQMFVESEINTYNRSQYIKFMYAVLRVTKAAQLAGLAQVPARDMLAIRIDAAQDALRALRERMLLGVNFQVNDTSFLYRSTLSLSNDSTNLYYNGIYQMIQGNTGSSKTWVTSAGNSYDQIMADLDSTYNTMVKYGMQPNLALCDYRVFGIIRRGLWEHFRTEPIKELATGISKISLVFPGADGLPLVPHPFLPQSSGNGAIMLVDTRLLARRVLWQDMYEDLAKINLSQKAVISAAETFVDKSDVNGSTSLHGGVFSIT